VLVAKTLGRYRTSTSDILSLLSPREELFLSSTRRYFDGRAQVERMSSMIYACRAIHSSAKAQSRRNSTHGRCSIRMRNSVKETGTGNIVYRQRTGPRDNILLLQVTFLRW